MKRAVLKSVMFLLGGALANVAVAWVAAAACPIHKQAARVVAAPMCDGRQLVVHEFPGWCGSRMLCFPGPHLAGTHQLTENQTQLLPQSILTPNQERLVFIADVRGWPLSSLWCELAMKGSGWSSRPQLGGIQLQAHSPAIAFDARILPLRPLWIGFTANTLFYTILLYLLITGPIALRRFIRARRGFCPKCTYPIGTSPVCSECGTKLPSRAVA